MGDILELIKEIAPGALFYVLLAIGIGWYLKHLSEQIVSNFKAITVESRENFKALLEESRKSKEDMVKDLSHYKEQLVTYREENVKLNDDLNELKSKITSLEGVLEEIRRSMQQQFARYQEGIDEFSSHSRALFSERDNLLNDLELAWKAIHLQHRARNPETTDEEIDGFKEQLKKA